MSLAVLLLMAVVAGRHPVFLVPGFGCSVLRKPGKRSNSWLEISKMLKPEEWIESNGVRYSDGRFIPKTSLSVWEGSDGVRDLVPEISWMKADFGQMYFGRLIDKVEHEGAAVRGIPYDFRTILDPVHMREFGEDLLRKLERMDDDNGSTGAVVVAHSMGAVVARAALSKADPDWLRRHVRALVEVCPAHGGSLYSLEVMLKGSFYLPILSGDVRKSVAEASRENAGLLLTLPNRMAFPDDRPLWVTADGEEIWAEEWPWGNVSDAWSRCSEPLIASVRDLPRCVASPVRGWSKTTARRRRRAAG